MSPLVENIEGGRLSVLGQRYNGLPPRALSRAPVNRKAIVSRISVRTSLSTAAEGWCTPAPRAAEPSLCLPSFRLRQAGAGPHPRPRRVLPARFPGSAYGSGSDRHSHLSPVPRQHAATSARQPATNHADYQADEQQQHDAAAKAASAGANGASSSSSSSGLLVATLSAASSSTSSTSGDSSSGGGNPLSSSDDEGRWHEAMHRALMESLQPPRSQHPSWWGKRSHTLQRRMAEVLESREAHYLVIGMVLLDLAIVLTELVLSSFYPTPELAPHIVHLVEESLSYTSIGILAIFTAELFAKLLVFGFKYFTHSSWHMFDAVIVVISLTLELSLRGVAQEVASLLIFFRLWRIMRIMHGVAEAMELNHSQDLQHLMARSHALEAELSATQQQLVEVQQQVALLHVAAAAKGIDLQYILTTAAAAQQQLAGTAQQQLLAAAAATASKGMELHTILAAAAAQQQQASAVAQQQLLAAAAAAAAGTAPPAAGSATSDRTLATAAAAAAAVVAAPSALLLQGREVAPGGGMQQQQQQEALPQQLQQESAGELGAAGNNDGHATQC